MKGFHWAPKTPLKGVLLKRNGFVVDGKDFTTTRAREANQVQPLINEIKGIRGMEQLKEKIESWPKETLESKLPSEWFEVPLNLEISCSNYLPSSLYLSLQLALDIQSLGVDPVQNEFVGIFGLVLDEFLQERNEEGIEFLLEVLHVVLLHFIIKLLNSQCLSHRHLYN